MALSNYSELKASIRDWLARPDLSDTAVDDMIAMAEARHRRELRLRDMEVRDTAVMSTTSRFIELPPSFIEMRRLYINQGTDPVYELSQISMQGMAGQIVIGAGLPSYFCVHNELEFDRVPDQAYQLEMVYFKYYDGLSDANPANWILTNAPDLYLYGALVHSAPYIGHDERARTWDVYYQESRDDLQYKDESGRYTGGTLQARVDHWIP